MRETKNAAFRVFDIFTENDSCRIFLQAEPQTFVDRVANPILARRQNFLVDFRPRAGHVRFQFVWRRILRFFGFAKFLTNAFFDFVVDLRELVAG